MAVRRPARGADKQRLAVGQVIRLIDFRQDESINSLFRTGDRTQYIGQEWVISRVYTHARDPVWRICLRNSGYVWPMHWCEQLPPPEHALQRLVNRYRGIEPPAVQLVHVATPTDAMGSFLERMRTSRFDMNDMGEVVGMRDT